MNARRTTIAISLIILFVCCILSSFETFFSSASPFVWPSEGTPEALGRLPTIFTRSVCPTRNMSYDLRRTIPIKRSEWPTLNSTIGPSNPENCLGHNIDP